VRACAAREMGDMMRAKTNGGPKRGIKKNGGKRNGARDGARRVVEREMAELYGFAPEFWDAVPNAVLQHAWRIHRDFQLEETALAPKVKELIGLALAAHIKCKYCTYFHSEAARFYGAKDEELREASTMGGYTALMSNALTGAEVDFDRFTREVDRAFEHLRRSMSKSSPARGGSRDKAPSRTARARA
jgi:AhpD family alkylhydroperoxidase